MKSRPYHSIIFLINIQLLSLSIGFSQHGNIDSNVNSHYDSISNDSLIRRNLLFWKPISDRICAKAGIDKFDSSRTNFHLRLYSGSQIIDIRHSSAGKFEGMLYQWADEITPRKEPITNRVYCLQEPLDTAQTNLLLHLYHNSGMDTLRHQENIVGWNTGLDGVTYLFETVQNARYQFRSYWTPDKESPVTEERLVYQFVDSAFSIAGGSRLQSFFRDNIPFNSWSNHTGTVISKVVTWSQYRAMKRERKRYRKTALKSGMLF